MDGAEVHTGYSIQFSNNRNLHVLFPQFDRFLLFARLYFPLLLLCIRCATVRSAKLVDTLHGIAWAKFKMASIRKMHVIKSVNKMTERNYKNPTQAKLREIEMASFFWEFVNRLICGELAFISNSQCIFRLIGIASIVWEKDIDRERKKERKREAKRKALLNELNYFRRYLVFFIGSHSVHLNNVIKSPRRIEFQIFSQFGEKIVICISMTVNNHIHKLCNAHYLLPKKNHRRKSREKIWKINETKTIKLIKRWVIIRWAYFMQTLPNFQIHFRLYKIPVKQWTKRQTIPFWNGLVTQ